MANSVRVAAVQMTSINDLTSNFATCSLLVKQAAAVGAKLLCFPENFAYVGAKQGDSLKIAEPLDGQIMKSYCNLARESNIWLSLGGFQEKGSDDTHLRNTHVVIDDGGNIRSTYSKMHLFDVDVPGGAVYKESSFTEPDVVGNIEKLLNSINDNTYVSSWKCSYDFDSSYAHIHGDLASQLGVLVRREAVVAVDSPIGRLGLTVCYDLRFPEIYQQLRFKHNAQVLLVPAAFTVETGKAHWEVLLRSRAIETQCYVIAAAQAGKHNDNRESYGNTLVIDPWGTIVGRLPDRLTTGIIVADIDFSLIDSVREKMPISQQRKPSDFWERS